MSAKVFSTTATPLSTAAQMAVPAEPVSPASLLAVAAPLKVPTVIASPVVGVSVAATQPELQISCEAIEAMPEAPLASAGLSSGTYSSERTLTREEMIKEGRIIQAPQQTWSAPLVVASAFVEPEALPGIATPMPVIVTPSVAPEGILEAAETSDSVSNFLREAEIFEPVVQVKEERGKGGLFGGFASCIQGICKVAPRPAAAPTGIPTDEMVQVQPLVKMAAPIATATGVTTEVCDEAPIAAAPVVTTMVSNYATHPVVSPPIVVVPTTTIAASSPAWTLGEIYTVPEGRKNIVQVPQIQSVDKIVEAPRSITSSTPELQIQEVVKTVQVPQIQEVLKEVQVPQLQQVEKPTTDPQIQAVEKEEVMVPIPHIQDEEVIVQAAPAVAVVPKSQEQVTSP